MSGKQQRIGKEIIVFLIMDPVMLRGNSEDAKTKASSSRMSEKA